MLLKITADGLLHWEHQKESHETIELSQKMGFKSGLIIGAPGSGKTFIGFEHALQTVQSYWEEGEKAQVFVLVPTKHIREQKLNVLKNNYTPETLQKVKALKDIHPELNIFVTAVDDFDATALKKADVIISTYQFFNLHEHEIKENKLPVKYLIVDEAGFSASPSYQKVIHAFNPDYTLGLSIEDIKFEGKRAMELLESNKHLLPANRIAEIESSGIIKLSDLYQGNLLVDMSSEEHIRDFIDKKILADIRVKSIDFEVKDFATQSMSSKTEDYITVDENNERDFDTPKLYKDLNREKLNLDIYNDYVTKVPDYKKEKPTICTSLSIEHAQDLAKLFKEKGIAAEALHSKLSDKDQKNILERFERGEIKVLMTVEMLKLGYDFPEVETILQNRPIYSRHTYINAVGRIWRYFAGKDYCLIVDRTWNFERYASHNMHTVFNRQYKYSDKEGEQFFTTANKDYLEKNEINYDFRNFLPVVNKKVEYALTANQLREWKILNAKTELKKLYERLNKNSNGLKEVMLNGVIFYKKDLNGLTVWTIKNSNKEKLLESSGWDFMPFDKANINEDIVLSYQNLPFLKKYWGVKNSIDELVNILNKRYVKTKNNIIKLERDLVTIEFVRKSNGNNKFVWTVSKSKMNDLIIFLKIKILIKLDTAKEIPVSSTHMDDLFESKQGSGLLKTLTKFLNEKRKKSEKYFFKLKRNGVSLVFYYRKNNTNGVWTIEKSKKDDLKKFLQIKFHVNFNAKTDLAITNSNQSFLKKYRGGYKKLTELVRSLPSQKNKVIKKRNGASIIFTRKIRENKPVWSIPKYQESQLIKFLGLKQIEAFNKESDFLITRRNIDFAKNVGGTAKRISSLIIELARESQKNSSNVLSKKRNGINIIFIKKWIKTGLAWTIPKEHPPLLIQFLGLTRLPLPIFNEKKDLKISNTNKPLLNKYYNLQNKFAKLVPLLNKESSIEVSLTQNKITLNFIKKWNKNRYVWTIDKSRENELIQFLELKTYPLLDESKDFLISHQNKTDFDQKKGFRYRFGPLISKLFDIDRESEREKINLKENGISLNFIKKLNKNGRAVWTLPKDQESLLIKFLGLE